MRGALVLVVLVLPLPVAAQVTAMGTAASVDPVAGTAPVRWPDVAFDPTSGSWLAVSGAGNVTGVWLGADGTALEPPFVVQATAGIYAQAPRVAWTGSGFFVAWHQSVGSTGTTIRGRVVRRGGASSGDFAVAPLGTNWEMGAALACSITSGECLVVWQTTADTRIAAQRVALDGTLRGGPIAVDPRAYYFRDPAAVLHVASDTFFVAYAGCVTDGDCFVAAQPIRAGTGELVGGPIELDAGIDAGYVPELAYGEATRDVLAVWHRRASGAATFEGRRIAADGTLGPPNHVADVGSYDANGLAYAATSNTFLFVTHGTTAEDVAIELSALGSPLGAPVPFGPASASGNFNPRVAASTSAGWLAITSTEFARLTAQRFTTSSRDPTGLAGADGGAPGLDAGSTIGPDAALDAPATDATRLDASTPRRSVPVSGCSCRASGRSAPPLLLLAIVAAVACGRRARTRAPVSSAP